MDGGQCVSDALPGFARSAERAQEHKQWGPFLEGQQEVHMTMSTDMNKSSAADTVRPAGFATGLGQASVSACVPLQGNR